MKETDLQSLIITAVNLHGGCAHKMNNRFLVGVADLLVKLPDCPAGFLEVKQRTRPTTDDPFKLDVTQPQGRFLTKFEMAGMPCGVASFLQEGNSLWLNVTSWRTLRYEDRNMKSCTVARTGHWPLSKKVEMRAQEIFNHIEHWIGQDHD